MAEQQIPDERNANEHDPSMSSLPPRERRLDIFRADEPHDPTHRVCLAEAVRLTVVSSRIIFPREVVTGIRMPLGRGDALVFIRAWCAIVGARAVVVTELAEEMAMEKSLEASTGQPESATAAAANVAYRERAHALALGMLKEMHERADVRPAVLDGLLRREPMPPFIEVMQIQAGIQTLGLRLSELLDGCERAAR